MSITYVGEDRRVSGKQLISGSRGEVVNTDASRGAQVRFRGMGSVWIPLAELRLRQNETEVPTLQECFRAQMIGALRMDLGKAVYRRATSNEWKELEHLIAGKLHFDLANAYEHPSMGGYTPLLAACFYGHLESVRVLLDANADVLVRSREKEEFTPTTPAGYARRSKNGQWEACVEAINEHIIKIAPSQSQQWLGEVVYGAAETNEYNLIKRLCDLLPEADLANADTGQGKSGNTPLLVACHFGHIESAKVLVDAGADLTVKSCGEVSGYLPADYARHFKNGSWEACVDVITAGPTGLTTCASKVKGEATEANKVDHIKDEVDDKFNINKRVGQNDLNCDHGYPCS